MIWSGFRLALEFQKIKYCAVGRHLVGWLDGERNAIVQLNDFPLKSSKGARVR